MIKLRKPGIGVVASVTTGTGLHMGRPLALRNHIIMTIRA